MSKTILKISLVCLLLSGSAAAQQFDPSAEQQLVQMLNLERARQGLPSLKLDDHLTQAARAHSILMAQKKELSHQFSGEPTLPKRLADAGVRLNNDAENVAYDYSVQAVHDGLMHSPPHRANILSDKYNRVGVGVMRSGDVLWATEDFAHELQNYSELDAEDAIIAAWERARRQSHAAPAQAARSPQLRRIACEMAKRGRLDAQAPLALPDVQSAVVYTQADPATLAPDAAKAARETAIRRFAVGACFGAAARYPAGTWWVAMVFY